MTPSWVLPVFPAMLSGSIASSIASSQPYEDRLPIIVAGVSYQGLGFLVSLIMMALYLGRLMVDGFACPEITTRHVHGRGTAILYIVGSDRHVHQHSRRLRLFCRTSNGQGRTATSGSGLLYLPVDVCILLFRNCTSRLCPRVQRVILEPGVLDLRVAHTGFAIATIGIGNQLNSDGIKWVGSIMTILLVVVWLFNMGMQVRAIYNKAILWPGKDEDHDELRDNKA
ncbi:C4-dicarboxylate transporter/malic acid transporter [Paraphaeosphaeria minitans]|uniref:C4-dicarboxylate transporter/malic acid transporter n=1 Tax=Paraphaeosphaeria minitans TaxID=565426 RepID=A0A9P6G9R8_9PLEO|nr:C4-dicarboxylate transporter/malic acid transporter [Paraphaeosphaeria minitans]